MTIDLSKCIGCGACVVACQAENNVPVVGKEQVLHGREMHWLRIDRYFEGDPADAARSCSSRCRVSSAKWPPASRSVRWAPPSHSQEGLNDMAYNRCIGMRYCANNCPYKVRRFNFFNYHKDLEDPANEVHKMVYNPEVTVRSRGRDGEMHLLRAADSGRQDRRQEPSAAQAIPDGEIKTACQQVCPDRRDRFRRSGRPGTAKCAKQHQLAADVPVAGRAERQAAGRRTWRGYAIRIRKLNRRR